METFTQEKKSIEDRIRTKEVDRLVQDARENVGYPSNLRNQRRSPERYIGYMDLMAELIEIDPSYLRKK